MPAPSRTSVDEAGASPRSCLPGQIWLDLTRLLYRVNRRVLTGVDRVELAYAEVLLDTVPDRLRFVTYDYRGEFRFIDHHRAADLVRAVGNGWRDGTLGRLSGRAARLLVSSVLAGRRLPRLREGTPRPTYVNVSSHPLHREREIGAMLRRTGARFVPLLHDIIPLDHPEYVAATWTLRAHARLKTVSNLADAVIANSAATAESLRPVLPPGMPILSAPLGVHRPDRLAIAVGPQGEDDPYFVILSTIEPRKNHITLLHLWRRFAQTPGMVVPKLLVIGARGWQNEHVWHFLDRCEIIRPHVRELGKLPDGEVATLLAGARALLMPSFTEGYGLPVAEALSAGVPVICSDIPAHREIGGDVPDFVDPLDTLAWGKAVTDFASATSTRRGDQLDRMQGWTCPTWVGHVEGALAFVDGLAEGVSSYAPNSRCVARPRRQRAFVKKALANGVPAAATATARSIHTGGDRLPEDDLTVSLRNTQLGSRRELWRTFPSG